MKVQKLLHHNYIIFPVEQARFSFEEWEFLTEFFNITFTEIYQEEKESLKRFFIFQKKPKYLYRI